MDFQSTLGAIHDAIAKLQASAAKLENKNLGDILGSARAKLSQALGHPDVNAAAAIHNSEVNYNWPKGGEG